MSMAEDSKTLSDEQVAQLHGDPNVKLARNLFLMKQIEWVKLGKNASPEFLKELGELDVEYQRVFNERLKEVIEHPPQPKTTALSQTDRLKGFKK